jgi:hypothetical protein
MTISSAARAVPGSNIAATAMHNSVRRNWTLTPARARVAFANLKKLLILSSHSETDRFLFRRVPILKLTAFSKLFCKN